MMGDLTYPRVEKIPKRMVIKCQNCKRKAKHVIIYENGVSEYYCTYHLHDTIAQIGAVIIFTYACEKAKQSLKKDLAKVF